MPWSGVDSESARRAPADFVKQDAGSNRYIQGIDLAEKGNGKKDIAVFSYERSYPLAFAAHDEARVPFKADRTQILISCSIGAVNPEPIFFHKFNGMNKVNDSGHRYMTGSAGRGFDDGWRDSGSSVPGNDNAVGTEAVSRADQRAQVLGVLNPVEQ